MTPDPEFLHQLEVARDAINAALNRAAGLEVLEGNRERLAAAPETGVDEEWEAGSMSAFIDSRERMTANGPVRREQADDPFAAFDRWMNAAPTKPLDAADETFIEEMRALRAAAPSTPDGGLPPASWWRDRGEHPPVSQAEAVARLARLAAAHPQDPPERETRNADTPTGTQPLSGMGNAGGLDAPKDDPTDE